MLNSNFAPDKLPKNSKSAPFLGFAGTKGDSWYKEMRKSPLYEDLHGTIMCTSILYQHLPDKFTGTHLLVPKVECWYSMLVQGKLDNNILILLIIIYIFAGTGKITGTACWCSATCRIHCVLRYYYRKCTSTPVILLIRQKQTFSVKKFGNFSGFDRTN
jgi:hypothetical protein